MAFRFIPGSRSTSDPDAYKRDDYWLDPNKPPGSLIDEAVVTVLVEDDLHAQDVIKEARRRGIKVRAERHSRDKALQLEVFLANLSS